MIYQVLISMTHYSMEGMEGMEDVEDVEGVVDVEGNGEEDLMIYLKY